MNNTKTNIFLSRSMVKIVIFEDKDHEVDIKTNTIDDGKTIKIFKNRWKNRQKEQIERKIRRIKRRIKRRISEQNPDNQPSTKTL